MTLRDIEDAGSAARRRERAILRAEQAVEEATDAAMRQFLRRVQQSITPAALTAAAGEGVPRPAHLFSLGQAAGWWEEAVDEHVTEAVSNVWRSGYFDTRDGELLRTSMSGADEFLANVTDRLSRTATPTIPEQAMDVARVALSDEMSRGSDISTTSRRLAAEFGWDEDATFWRGRMQELDSQADRILDRIGPPGDSAREATRTGRIPDETLQRIQDERAEARKHIDRVESTWQTRSERIARTETTGAYNAGSVQAAHDEGAGVKIWLATGDDRTRDEHLEASGQCVPVDDDFTVGGEPINMPADPSGSPELTINCRCTMVFAPSCEDGKRRFDEDQGPIDEERERRGEDPPAEEPQRLDADDPEDAGPPPEPREVDSLADANTWGQEQFGGLRDQVTSEEQFALADYQRQGYRNVNGYHRGQIDPTDTIGRQRAEQMTEQMDSVMAKAGGPDEPVRVYRGIGSEAVEDLGGAAGDMTGADFRDPGYMSTALNMDETDYFTRQAGSAVLEIDVPAGTPSVYADAVTHLTGDIAGRSVGESEMLLARNMRVVVDGPTGKVNGRGAPVYRAHIEPEG